MIEKIEIKDTATYKNETLDNLNKINFIYGNNGSGKTTISRIIRDENAYSNCKITWKDATKLETLVYNSDFIEENFQPSQEIKGIFTLGKEEVDTQNKINEEKNKIEVLNSEIAEIVEKIDKNDKDEKSINSKAKDDFWDVKLLLDKSSLTNALVGVKGKKEDFFNKVLMENSKNTSELKNKDEIEKLAEKCYLDTRVPLNLISPISFESILEKEKDDILKKAIIGKEDLDISALIKELNNSDWVKSGMKYFSVQNAKCPFCQQIFPPELESKLNSYFDKTYENDKKTVENLKENYERDARNILNNIKELLNSQLKQVNIEELKNNYYELQKIINSNIRILENKLNNLSQKYSLNSISDFNIKINSIIDEANTKIKDHNEFLKNLTNEKKKLEPLVWKYICNELKDNISKYSSDIKNIKEERKALEKAKSDNEIELDKHKELLKELEKKLTSVQPTLDSINKLLNDFNFTGFRLAQGNSKYSYKIERLDGTPVQKTLSEGEKSFVTFLYFYNLLNGSQNSSGVVNNRIVVIDDPVSSLDNDILFTVSTLIRFLYEKIDNGASSIKQLLLFSHNTYFFNEVTYHNGYAKNFSYFVIKKQNGISSIHNNEKQNPITSSYDLLWMEVRIAKSHPENANIITIQNSMRRILEYYFQFLGDIDIKKLHKDKILKDKNDVTIYRTLMSWVNSGSHSTFDDCFYVENDSSLLQKYMDMFELIFKDSGNESHYQMMINKSN